MMPLSLSYDHRLSTAPRLAFLNEVIDYLQAPASCSGRR